MTRHLATLRLYRARRAISCTPRTLPAAFGLRALLQQAIFQWGLARPLSQLLCSAVDPPLSVRYTRLQRSLYANCARDQHARTAGITDTYAAVVIAEPSPNQLVLQDPTLLLKEGCSSLKRAHRSLLAGINSLSSRSCYPLLNT